MAAVCHRSGWNGARGFWGEVTGVIGGGKREVCLDMGSQ